MMTPSKNAWYKEYAVDENIAQSEDGKTGFRA